MTLKSSDFDWLMKDGSKVRPYACVDHRRQDCLVGASAESGGSPLAKAAMARWISNLGGGFW